MPQLTVEGVGVFVVAPGKRLVLALEEDAGIDQLHALRRSRPVHDVPRRVRRR